MPNALFTGVTGLLAHQRMLDVVGHNIANLNTTAFKAQKALFADLFYETLSAPSSASATRGGTNGSQIGLVSLSPSASPQILHSIPVHFRGRL